MLKEAYLEGKCVSYFRKQGGFTAKLNPIANKGVPDRVFVKDGKVFFVEFKTPQGKLSPMQKLNKQLIETSGGLYYVIRTYDEFVQLSERSS